ncbi:MAG: hypothetical protein ACFBSG_15465 [Leptolyngbyaceae cyanobacterium]
MSLLICFVLIAIAWLWATLIDNLLDWWHLIGQLPLWLIVVAVAGGLSWFVGDP